MSEPFVKLAEIDFASSLRDRPYVSTDLEKRVLSQEAARRIMELEPHPMCRCAPVINLALGHNLQRIQKKPDTRYMYGDLEMPGLRHAGLIEVAGVNGELRARLHGSLCMGGMQPFELQFNNETFRFQGCVTHAMDHPEGATFTIRPVGQLNPVKQERLMKVRNKFYVAAPSVTSNSEQNQINDEKSVKLSVTPTDRSGKWTRKDLASAVAHATQVLRDDPSKDHVAVVRIVKIVRRKEAPVVVENV